jgi:CubicO group peptidase (beta-lactamase class C family)
MMLNNLLKRRLTIVLILSTLCCLSSVAAFQSNSRQRAQSSRVQEFIYYPSRGDGWQHKRPEEVGMESRSLEQAVAYAKTQESKVPQDFSTQVETFGSLLGPLPKERGESNGIIIRHGYIVAEWGDTKRIDPTYSVAKSFLSTLVGLAIDRGLIKSINDPVRKYVNDGGYESVHNSKITWEEHVQQTSEWEGAMWGKSHDFIGVEQFGKGRRERRELREPGTYWEYNDVRINRLALSLLRIWRKPLPQVLKEEVMNPIGASQTWQYHGYFNSDVVINGQKMPSIGGGTRWGGGLWISTRDEARFGYLFLRQGKWRDRQIISEQWVRMATMPCKVKPDYGYLWWLNSGHKQWPSAPGSSFAALGYGSNTIWIDPEHDLVVVWRWHQANPDELIRRVLSSIK